MNERLNKQILTPSLLFYRKSLEQILPSGNYAEDLKFIFDEMGLTKGEIINRLSVNKTVLLRWLQGETFPAKSHIDRIVSLAKDILNLDFDPLTLSVVKEPSEWKEIGEGDLALPRKAQKTIIGKLSQPGNMQEKDIVLLKNSPYDVEPAIYVKMLAAGDRKSVV